MNNHEPILGPSGDLVKREAERWPRTRMEAELMLFESLKKLRESGQCQTLQSLARRNALRKLEAILLRKRAPRGRVGNRLLEIINEYIATSEPKSGFEIDHDEAITRIRRCQHQIRNKS